MDLESIYDSAISTGAAKVDVHVLPDRAFVQRRVCGKLQEPEPISPDDGRSLVAEAASLPAMCAPVRHTLAPGKDVLVGMVSYGEQGADRAIVLMLTLAPEAALRERDVGRRQECT